ncbi:MAG: hypothetical protein KDK76_07160, partial [Chlamydiia bacterium]|nr:hypothetical protein [Chlamydiia bacterium]
CQINSDEQNDPVRNAKRSVGSSLNIQDSVESCRLQFIYATKPPTLLLPTVGSDAGLAAYDRLSGTQLCQIGDPRDAIVAVRRISDNQKIMEALFRYL